MTVARRLTEGELDALRQFETGMVANAVETFYPQTSQYRFRGRPRSMDVSGCADGWLCGHGSR